MFVWAGIALSVSTNSILTATSTACFKVNSSSYNNVLSIISTDTKKKKKPSTPLKLFQTHMICSETLILPTSSLQFYFNFESYNEM